MSSRKDVLYNESLKGAYNETSRKLDLWRKAIEFVVAICRLTENFPKEEKFGLTSQMRRASVSIAANIAEGAARTSVKEFAQFLSHSQGSASEVDTELVIAGRLGYVLEKDYQKLSRDLDDIGRMITRLCQSLRKEV